VELFARFGYIIQVTRVLLFLVVVGATVTAHAQPALEIDRAEFDFGLVPDHGTLVHQTWLRSTGEDTLEIIDLKTGCGCITAPLDKRWLAPGDSVLLTLRWRILGIGGQSVRVPYLFCNDDTSPHRMLLQVEVTPADDPATTMSCRPQKIDFEGTDRRKDYRKIFTIQNHTDSDQAVSLVSYADDAYSIELPDTVAAQSSATGIVILASEYADKEFEQSFTLEFLDSEETAFRVSVPVSRGDFSFRPTLTTTIDTTGSNITKR